MPRLIREHNLPGLDGMMPKEPHLLLYTSLTDPPQAAAIPRGANIGVQLGEHWSPLTRMILVEVAKTRLVFRCACSPQCTVVFTYRLDEKGRHPRR